MQHNIEPTDVSKDPIDEEIAPMCNYICKEYILIQPDDIVIRAVPVGLWHGTETEILELTDYLREPPPINQQQLPR